MCYMPEMNNLNEKRLIQNMVAIFNSIFYLNLFEGVIKLNKPKFFLKKPQFPTLLRRFIKHYLETD